MTTDEQTNQILNAKLEALELESRRVLRALRWSTKVRLVLVIALILFVIVFSFFFYRLYNDIRDRRIAEVQRIINENPEEFSEPLTRQLIVLAEDQGPYVGEVFRQQFALDSQKYVDAFDTERDIFIDNMQVMLESKLDLANEAVMSEHEEILRREFPELVDDQKMELIKENMQEIYTQVGKRYYVDFMGDRLKDIVGRLDTFPAATPRAAGLPLGEQIGTEMLELVRMMVIASENYVPPVDEERIPLQINPAATTKEPPPAKDDNEVVDPAEKDDGNPSDKDDNGSENSDETAGGEDGEPNKDDGDNDDDVSGADKEDGPANETEEGGDGSKSGEGDGEPDEDDSKSGEGESEDG